MNFDRREFIYTFLSGLAALGFRQNLFPKNFVLQKENGKMLKPSPLKPNDMVGIISPATSVSDPDDIARAIEIVERLNLRYRFGKYLLKGSGYKTRTIEERLDDLHSMFANPEIRAIFCIRGGYGSSQLLDKIDYNLISINPKIFVGYSDITALHIAFQKFANLVTFHGPVLISAFTKFTFDSFRQILFAQQVYRKITNPEESGGLRNSFPIRTINSGRTEGRLIGGNLSIITSLLGTPYQYDYENSILLIEDVGEQPYRIDRMLNQLRLAGVLEKINGIAFGRCDDCINTTTPIWDFSLGEVLDYYLKPLKKPAFYGLLFGHTSNQVTVPLGIQAAFDSTNGIIELIESPFE